MIRLDGVDVDRGAVRALEALDLEIDRGTYAAVIGPNGAGKSTLFGLISGRLRPTRGAVHDRSIDCLSGGQRQRLLLAQGLAQQADVLLLDEPTTGLDIPSRERILEIIHEERDAGRTVLCATHDLHDARRADVVIALARRCLCCAPPQAALADPDVIALFERDPLRPPARGSGRCAAPATTSAP